MCVITYTRMPEVREWDGKSYDRISGPMEALGREVLARLELRGDETVLDAGCGSGRITQALLDRGYTPEQVRKILGGNLLRVFRRVEQVSRRMQQEERALR